MQSARKTGTRIRRRFLERVSGPLNETYSVTLTVVVWSVGRRQQTPNVMTVHGDSANYMC